MKTFAKTYWKTILFFSIISLIGGFFVGLYLLDNYPPEIKQQLLAELSKEGLDLIPINIFVGLISALQSAGYGLVLGTIGIILAKKIGLWKDEKAITKKPLIASLIVAFIGGLGIILPDIFFFGYYSEVIKNSYALKPTIPYILATVTYGAVIEEVMIRLFMMSLIAFVLHKLLKKNGDKPTVVILIIANIISALLFAAGHLPVTIMTIGTSPMIIFRCFLLNGTFGLLFGWLYRKYGLRYAMIAHGGCHIVSKAIWLIFL